MGFIDFLKKAAEELNALTPQGKEAALQRKARLLEWQNLIMQEERTDLIMTEQQLRQFTTQQAQNDLRIINDCARLVQTTTKPDVFFSRLQLLWEKSEHLAKLEKYISFSGASPSAAFAEVRENHQTAITEFLIRYFSETFDKAEAMKTEKGRIGKYQKFYDSLQDYYRYMNDENIDYIETKYAAYTRK